MRICTPHCGIAPESGSGGETYERELLKGLGAMGVTCHILLAAGKPHDQNVPNWRVHPVWPPKGLRWWVNPLVFPRYVKKLWDQEGFDLLRIHAVRYVGPATLLARWRYRLPVPVVTHHHHVDPSRLNRVIDRRVVEASDLVVTDSEFARRQIMSELGVSGENMRVVYCGVGPKYAPGPKDPALIERWGLRGKQVLLATGFLIERKNPLFLVRAMAEVRRRVGPNVVLLLVGDGPLRGRIREEVARLGLGGSVILAGYVPEAQKVATLNLADVFVFASVLEGFPLAPQEAMGCGKPVVAFRAASLAEQVVDGETGFLVGPNDVAAFADRVAQLLGSPDLARRIGGAANERVDRLFRWDRTVRRVLDVYEEAVRTFRKGEVNTTVWPTGESARSGGSLTRTR
jgi:glycosyltransferase involved in cell wall biosynthesis